jgi:hypothetical protein
MHVLPQGQRIKCLWLIFRIRLALEAKLLAGSRIDALLATSIENISKCGRRLFGHGKHGGRPGSLAGSPLLWALYILFIEPVPART